MTQKKGLHDNLGIKNTHVHVQSRNTQTDIMQLVESGVRHATNRPANGVEHASLLLMPIDMYPQQM